MAWLLDGLVVAGYFVLIVWIGLSMGRKEESLHDFALGGRRIPWWAVLASIIAAETSAGTFLGTPGEGFAKLNFTYVQLALGTVIARVIIAGVFLKPYFDYNVYSIYEFLNLRFGEATRTTASGIFLVTRVLASGARLYIGAIVLVVGWEVVTGVRPDSMQTLGLYIGAIVLVVLMTAIYTVLGGIKAVIWTDVIQATLMMGSACAAGVILLGTIPGGLSGVGHWIGGWETLKFFDAGLPASGGRWDAIKAVLTSEYTIFAALLGSTFTTMATHGTDQDMVQRMLTAENLKRSRVSLVLSGLADIPIVLIFLGIGVLLWVHYQALPDAGLPQKTNEIFAYFILTGLPPGMRGLLVAGIFATTMGSLSAALNALATSFVRDFHSKIVTQNTSAAGEASTLKAARTATIVFAVLMVLVASGTAYFVILYPKARIIPIVLGIFGYTYGSLLGVFLAGMLTKTRGSDRGNLVAMAVGFVVVGILSGLPNDAASIFGGKLYTQPDWLPVISFPWRVMFGTIATCAVALLFPTPPAKVAELAARS